MRTCEHCGGPNDTPRARYCSNTCRAKASQKRRREGGEVVQIRASSEPVEGGLVDSVRAALAGKSGWRVDHALTLATKLATQGEAGAAALSKELDRVMSELIPERAEADELDEMQADVLAFRRRRA